MNFPTRDFLYHRGLSKTTYRGTWNRSNVLRLGSLCLGFQPRTDGAAIIGGITGANSVRGQPYFAPNRRRPDHWQYCRSQIGSGLRMEKNFGSGLNGEISTMAKSK